MRKNQKLVDRRLNQFIKANTVDNGVVYGRVIDGDKGGAEYRLRDGRSWILDVDQCRALPSTHPIWAFLPMVKDQ